MKKLPTWIDVYPQGTKEGDEEQSFFIAISRHPKYDWLSPGSISKISNLNIERVEDIIEKYAIMGLVINNPDNEEQWGYWERVPEYVKKNTHLLDEDRQRRIKKYLKKSS